MNENDFAKIESVIVRHVGAFADSIQHKLDIVVEGQQMLSEKIDRVEERLDGRIDCVASKLDAVAAETSANTIAIRDLTHRDLCITSQIRRRRHIGKSRYPVLSVISWIPDQARNDETGVMQSSRHRANLIGTFR